MTIFVKSVSVSLTNKKLIPFVCASRDSVYVFSWELNAQVL
jgi:hypothetical protein